jgi:hypothetical protein
MNLFYRFILFILTILFMFATLLLAIYCFGFTGSYMIPDLIYSIYQRWEIGLLFLLGFIAGAWVIYPFFVKEMKNTTLISKSDLGKVDISLSALDNLVHSISIQQEGVTEISNRLTAGDDGLHIFLKGKILPNTNLPELTSTLQTIVKSYIEDTTGVKVAEVSVLIEGVSDKSSTNVE